MCDETGVGGRGGGNAHWQSLSCLFLCHTHTKAFGLPQLAPPAVCELVSVASGQAVPPHAPSPTSPPPQPLSSPLPPSSSPMQTQSAPGSRKRICWPFPPPPRIICSPSAIRDQNAAIGMPHEYGSGVFDQWTGAVRGVSGRAPRESQRAVCLVNVCLATTVPWQLGTITREGVPQRWWSSAVWCGRRCRGSSHRHDIQDNGTSWSVALF